MINCGSVWDKLWVSAGYRRIRDSEKLIYTIHTRMKDLDCVCKDESQNNKGTGQGKKSGASELSSSEKAEKKR